MSRSILATAAAAVAWGCSGSPSPEAHPASPPAAAPDADAPFADANLARAVRRALDLAADEPLSQAALRAVTSLHAPDARITDLRGIDALARLEELYIYGSNSITDVTPLGGLAALRDLNLARNEIEDIGPLAELSTLTSLSLYGNPIRDIAPLATLTGLTRLQVAHTAGVSDLSALAGLTGLTRLELAGNGIADLTPLTGLVHLTWLSLQDNPDVDDIEPLSELTELETLSLGGTGVRDLAPLAALSGLTTLGLEGTPVVDLGALIGLQHLSRIDLRGNRDLTDIQPLLFNPSLGRGDAVRLERTGVSCEDIAALRQKGVTVLAGCE